MAGLVQQKFYDWKETNLALFGSDLDKSVKKEAAETEPAWNSVRSITDNALLVWRIKSFKLEPVKADDVGKFFSGDSYIVLNVHKLGNELLYDVHFWIGRESTQNKRSCIDRATQEFVLMDSNVWCPKDEYGTAAYKTVELDTFLDDKAVQHREVDGFESEQFKTYFKHFETLEGGYTSGFNHVKPEEFKPRLLHFGTVDTRHVELREVTFSKRSLNSGDVFILDLGTKAYQWNGKEANKDEKVKAAMFLQELESERNGRCQTEVIDESDSEETKKFVALLPDVPVSKKFDQEIGKKAIYRLSDSSGKMKLTLVCEDNLPRGAITQDDVYFIDTGKSLFVYIGDQCSRSEKLDAMSHAHDYLKKTNHPLAPITVVSGNRKSKELDKVLE